MARQGVFNFNRKSNFEPAKGSSTAESYDVYEKLTALLKRGLGRSYIEKPKNLDAPVKTRHKEILDSQFAKATYDYYMLVTQIDPDRYRAFEDFRGMDYCTEIASALDIYADESTTTSEEGKILTITSDNQRVQNVLTNLFEDVLDVDHNLWSWIRQLVKWGNHYLLLDVDENNGIRGFMQLPVMDMLREEAYDGNIRSVKFKWQSQNQSFDAWQIAHFRLLIDERHLPYGTSILESSRRIWKQLMLAEDAMIVYRISRAPERRIFYVDVGNLEPADVKAYIQEVKNSIKKAPLVEQKTGNISFKYNALSIDEDYFVPRRGDKSTSIETLPGASNLDAIADIDYLQNKLFAGLKVPKAYLTYEGDVNAKATLSQEDFRFARTINRVQQAVIAELNKIAIIHLYTLGFRDIDQLKEFKLELTNPSTQYELEKIRIWTEKATAFRALWSSADISPVSLIWGLREIMGFSNEEIKIILKQQFMEGRIKQDILNAAGIGPEAMGSGDGTAFGGIPPESNAPVAGTDDSPMQQTPISQDNFESLARNGTIIQRPNYKVILTSEVVENMLEIGCELKSRKSKGIVSESSNLLKRNDATVKNTEKLLSLIDKKVIKTGN
jgi:hypothetical protein